MPRTRCASIFMSPPKAIGPWAGGLYASDARDYRAGMEQAGSELDGKVALVTGAARGQGRAIARRLAAEGARVVAGDVLVDELATLRTELGDAVHTGRLDVQDGRSWQELVDRGVEVFGR